MSLGNENNYKSKAVKFTGNESAAINFKKQEEK